MPKRSCKNENNQLTVLCNIVYEYHKQTDVSRKSGTELVISLHDITDAQKRTKLSSVD